MTGVETVVPDSAVLEAPKKLGFGASAAIGWLLDEYDVMTMLFLF